MGGTEGGKEGGGERGGRGGRGGSKVMVGEGTRGGRERRREGGSKAMAGEATRGGRERRREGESNGRERGSKDATQAWGKGGLREGWLMMGTSEEGTGRGMGGGREEVSGGGDCAVK